MMNQPHQPQLQLVLDLSVILQCDVPHQVPFRRYIMRVLQDDCGFAVTDRTERPNDTMPSRQDGAVLRVPEVTTRGLIQLWGKSTTEPRQARTEILVNLLRMLSNPQYLQQPPDYTPPQQLLSHLDQLQKSP